MNKEAIILKQSFIVLGEGLTDLFEFQALIEYNHPRIAHIVCFHTPLSDAQKSSVAIIMEPTRERHFQAMYIMMNAFPYPYPNSNKKFELITQWANDYNITVKGVDVQPSDAYYTQDAYFQYLISVLRLQRWIPPLQ